MELYGPGVAKGGTAHVVIEDGAGHDVATEEAGAIRLHGVQSAVLPGEGAKGWGGCADTIGNGRGLAGRASLLADGNGDDAKADSSAGNDRQAAGSAGTCRKATV
jgi:hypothetical protein